MHPITHALTGWALAHTLPLERRDRVLVTLSALLPDLDGLGVLVDMATEGGPHPTVFFDQFHHVALHNVATAAVLGLAALLAARRRLATAGLVLLSFHLHLLQDLVGSRGPDGYTWPIPYLLPFSSAWAWEWSGQWGFKAWPNVVLTLALLGWTLKWAWKRGRSPLELISLRADAALVKTLRSRFGTPCE